MQRFLLSVIKKVPLSTLSSSCHFSALLYLYFSVFFLFHPHTSMKKMKYIDVTLKMRVSSYKYIETANLYFGETVGIAKIEEISKNASLLHKRESTLLILILFSTVCVSNSFLFLLFIHWIIFFMYSRIRAIDEGTNNGIDECNKEEAL